MTLASTEQDVLKVIAELGKATAFDINRRIGLTLGYVEYLCNYLRIVLSGGTSLPKGFADRFRQILEQSKFPLPVREVRMASQPLRSVAKGALVAASADESKIGGAQ